MSQKPWLLLSDYSNKYEVSISTLRRRIREESIEFKLDGGKYFIADAPPTMKPRGRKPVAEDQRRDFFDQGSEIGSAVYFDAEEMSPVSGSGEMPPKPSAQPNTDFGLNVANKYLEELKKAYSQILQEKEELILQLKEEIADLRTLAQVLESENDRLRGR